MRKLVAAVLIAAIVAGCGDAKPDGGGGGGGGDAGPRLKCKYPGGIVQPLPRDISSADWEEACAANGGVPAP